MREPTQFTVCDSVSRAILRVGVCEKTDIPLQVADGVEVLIEGISGDMSSQRLNDTGDGLEARPVTLAEVRAKARTLLDESAARESATSVAVTVQGTECRIPARAELRLRLLRASLRAAANPAFSFRVKLGGAHLTLSASEVTTAQDAVDAWEDAIAAREEVLESQIQAATTKAEVNALLPAIRRFWP
jgi:hypothetical protein